MQLLIANNMAVLSAIIKAMNPTEAEEICGALLAGTYKPASRPASRHCAMPHHQLTTDLVEPPTVFHCNGKGHNLILWTMERELKVEKVPENLFRGVSLAASLMSKYFRMSASDYLRSILRPIVKEVKTKDMRIEVDPARTKEDAGESLRENQTKLIHLSKLVFDLLVASLDQVPPSSSQLRSASPRLVLTCVSSSSSACVSCASCASCVVGVCRQSRVLGFGVCVSSAVPLQSEG